MKQINFIAPIAVAVAFLAATQTTSRADAQFGIGPSLYTNSEFGDEAGYGANVELGYLNSTSPINLFLGVRAGYLDGSDEGDTDVDVFDLSLMGRVLVPVGFDAIKLYGEGRLGTGNLSVSGDVKARGKVNGRSVDVNTDLDSDDWTVGWGLGAGIQFDLGRSIGLRIGYDLHSYGDVEAFGLKMDSGFFHGASASLIFKF